MKFGYLIVMVLCMMPLAFAAVPDSASMKVQLLSQDPDPVIAGSFVGLRFMVENLGREDVTQFIFEVIPEYPFALESSDDGIRSPGTIYANQIGDKAFVFYYNMKVSQDAVEGLYDVRVRYSVDGGLTWRRLDPYAVRVESRDPLVAVRQVSADPEVSVPGDELTLGITLENLGDVYIKNVRVALTLYQLSQTGSPLELPFSPVGSSNEKVIDTMAPKKSEKLQFVLVSDADAQPKVYKIPLTVTYEDDAGTKFTKQELVSIRVGVKPELMVRLESSDPFIIGQSNMI
ncbi:MAG: hypothetical protein V1695_01025, partial [Candidatus Uhrbacteria bacterium]